MDEAESIEVGEGDGRSGLIKRKAGARVEEKGRRTHSLSVGSWLASGLRLEISTHSERLFPRLTAQHSTAQHSTASFEQHSRAQRSATSALAP
jgi:hypothetical protein